MNGEDATENEADQTAPKMDKTPEKPVVAGTEASSNAYDSLKDARYGHVYRKDAFLVFRCVCKTGEGYRMQPTCEAPPPPFPPCHPTLTPASIPQLHVPAEHEGSAGES